MPYPVQVPILSKNEFLCTSSCDVKKKKHCLMEWANIVFGILEENSGWYMDLDEELDSVPRKVYKTIEKECVRLRKKLKLNEPVTDPDDNIRDVIIAHNDYCFKPEQLAEIWNTSMKKLGYTETTYSVV